MKKDIHPPYFREAKVRCACGAEFVIGSTKELIEVEICSQCHPFYTGKGKIIDTAGRVERFRTRVLRAKPVNIRKEREAKRESRRQKQKKV